MSLIARKRSFQLSFCYSVSRLLFTTSRAAAAFASSSSTPTTSNVLPVYFDSTNDMHRDLQYHPEQPARITACVSAIEKLMERRQNESGGKCPMVQLIDVAPDSDRTSESSHHKQPFSDEELQHARKILLKTHEPYLVSKLEERCSSSRQRRIDEGKAPLGHMGYIDADTYLTTESFDVALRATAAWIRAVNFVVDRDDDNERVGKAAFALTRPPGHHATYGTSNGFCIFNNAAAAAVHVLMNDPSKKVSIIDWDVHYGQGVADIVRRHEHARYVSIHQVPAFPYMGEKLGIDGDFQNVLTIPVSPSTTWSKFLYRASSWYYSLSHFFLFVACGFKECFEKALKFVFDEDGWDPDVVIVCAGYDALDSDELANVSLQAKDYSAMTTMLWNRLSSSTSMNKKPAVVLGLEGGYQLSPMAGGGNLPDAVVKTIESLIDSTSEAGDSRRL